MQHTTHTNTNLPIALVTGASRGIGRAIAQQLARDFTVLLVARHADTLRHVQHAIADAGGISIIENCDVSDQAAVNHLIKKLPPIDVLVNNAGRSGGGVTAQLDDTLWHDIMRHNLHSVYYVTKGLLACKKINTPGSIINIASTAGKQGVPYAAAYTASKHAVVGFSKALGLELAQQGITVNAVCPGFVDTDLAQEVRAAYAKLWQLNADAVQQRITARIPLGRYVTVNEVAAMVAFLASPNARAITAQALNVCGGLGNY